MRQEGRKATIIPVQIRCPCVIYHLVNIEHLKAWGELLEDSIIANLENIRSQDTKGGDEEIAHKNQVMS